MSITNGDTGGFVTDLRELLLRRLGGDLQVMLATADNTLFELARSERGGRQRGFLDARDLLRPERTRERLAQLFNQALIRSFTETVQPPVIEPADADELSLQGNEELEVSIQILDAATRAQSVHSLALQQLASRTESFARSTPGLEEAACLTPRSFCEAFNGSLKELQFPGEARVAMGRLFERSALSRLQELYADALALCDSRGLPAAAKRAARVLPRAAAPAASAMPQAQPQPQAGSPAAQPQPPRQPPQGQPQPLDALTAGLLQRVQEGRAPRLAGDTPPSRFLPGFGPSFTDTDLASDLIRASRGEALPDFGPAQLQAMNQRAALVGRMFNQILSDPQIPSALSNVVEAFRFPAIKAALADPNFFADHRHPVRGLINDMAAMAAGTRLSGNDAVPRFEGWARRVLTQAELDAQSVRERARVATPLPPNAVDRFLQDQSRQGIERRGTLLLKARQAVDQELELNTVGHEVPESVQPLLRSGWGPMMASHLLRHGPESQLWRSGMELLHRVLYSLSPDSPNARTPAERAALRRDLLQALGGVGMTPDRAQSLVKGLDRALDVFEKHDPPGTGAAQPAAVDAVAKPQPAAVAPPAVLAPAPPPAIAAPVLATPAAAAAPAAATVAAPVVSKPAAVLPPAAVAPPAPVVPAQPLVAAADAVPPSELAKSVAEPLAATAAPAKPVAAAASQKPANAPVTAPPPAVTAAVAAPKNDAATAKAAPQPAAAPTRTAEEQPVAAPPAVVAAPPAVVAAPIAQVEPVATAEPEAPAAPKAETVAEAPAPASVVCLPLDLPTPQRLLEQLLKLGSWFRIYDRQSQGTRWLKLLSWFPQVQRASFAEFDGHNVLTIHARDLLEDLMEGRSEPIDIPPQTVLVLQALRQRHAEGHGNASGDASSSMVA